ncbi:MAG: hypothetical protein R2827_12270 [Bdellovibrionales bacterium]
MGRLFRNVLMSSLVAFGSVSFADTFTGYEIDAGWSLPTQIGARFKAFFNDTTYIAGGLGYSPSFTSGATEFMTFGPNAEGAYILSQTLSDSFVVDLRVGYQGQVDNGYFEALIATLWGRGTWTDKIFKIMI